MLNFRIAVVRLLAVLTFSMLAGCATLQQMAALRRVDFALDRVDSARIAGVELSRVSSVRDIPVLDMARLGTALARRDLPFEFTLFLSALNPPDNSVSARLVQMDWTLLLDDRETISGRTNSEFQLNPGTVVDIPVSISLDLADFFDHNASDMLELALAVAGAGSQPKRVSLRATPTIQTALGPIRYPEPITIISKTIGRQ